ncbi:ABC transporter ATP-binding protein [Bacillus sp. JCM 19034]|uniref:ABC transporter ATP-binding protein n=1 Tax=Bacillus sp. JCM 19034 TaxID=1481928 RepID=UPI000785474E|nr:ATP-binding cassette domain-containing protein [Bacillus sp. JCM 19034]
MSQTMIEVNQLTKTFKSKVAVNKVDLKIEKGEIFGLIGQNGAGKSTLLKMIGGLTFPTSGEIYLFDRPIKNDHPYFERMGLLIEDIGLFPNYSAYENLQLIAIGYGLKDYSKEINEHLEAVGLDATSKTKVKHYSMGMKQRLGIAVALMGSPDVLILDEPINGLDPQGISEIRTLILALNKAGMTIIISSHILEELSKVATKYAILHNGEILEVQSKEELLQKCQDRIELVVEEVSVAVTILEQQLNIVNYKVGENRTIFIYDMHMKPFQIVNALVKSNIKVHSIIEHKQSLEQYFLQLTGSEEKPHDKYS